MLKIVTDSACDMPSDWADEYDIQVIPLNIHFGEQTYLPGIDLTNEGFYRLVDETGIVPTTSQPTPQQFVDFYRRIAEPGDAILSIHLTSKLSGTFNSAEMAARELKGEYDVIPFDTAAGSAAQGYVAREARQMECDGASVDEILERLKFIRDHTEIILTLDTLDYARMSGRVKALQAALASVLNVKPIVILSDGILDMSDKVRTRSRSLKHILDLIKERIGSQRANVAVVHARDPEAGKSLMEKVGKLLDCATLIMTDLSIGIAANLGPGTVGIVAYPIA
ncbi:MAG: DegV family protein [Chloroflexota bacterium]|nr:DegV family protein [Chloroflexota bacterium]